MCWISVSSLRKLPECQLNPTSGMTAASRGKRWMMPLDICLGALLINYIWMWFRSDHLNCDLLLAESFNLHLANFAGKVRHKDFLELYAWFTWLGSAGCSWSVGPTMSWHTGWPNFSSVGFPFLVCLKTIMIHQPGYFFWLVLSQQWAGKMRRFLFLDHLTWSGWAGKS